VGDVVKHLDKAIENANRPRRTTGGTIQLNIHFKEPNDAMRIEAVSKALGLTPIPWARAVLLDALDAHEKKRPAKKEPSP
jgi:hypothetical protein